MPTLPFIISPVRLRGADAEAVYRERVDRRDRLVLRFLAFIILVNQSGRTYFEWNLAPEMIEATIGLRLGGIACVLAILASSFHPVLKRYILVVFAACLLASVFQISKSYAIMSIGMNNITNGIWIAVLLFGILAFRIRMVGFVAGMAVGLPVMVTLAGMDQGSWYVITGMFVLVTTVSLTVSYVLEQHWRRMFNVEMELADSHAELKRTHEELSVAYATLQETQAQLVRAEKMASLGTLVANVAHRLGTPVGAVLGASSYIVETAEEMARRMKDGGVRRSELAEFIRVTGEAGTLALDNARRTGALIDAFKRLAADTVEEPGQLDLVAVLTGLAPSLRAMTPPSVALVLEVPPSVGVLAQFQLLETVLQELVQNAAAYAFPHGARGTITVSARPAPDGFVDLTVRDDGCGIPPERLAHIFDPFHADRRFSGLRGLGLAIVHNVVVGPLGGRIAIDSREGEGTSVTVRLPATEAATEKAPALSLPR